MKVSVDESFLYVSNYSKGIRIPLCDIGDVTGVVRLRGNSANSKNLRRGTLAHGVLKDRLMTEGREMLEQTRAPAHAGRARKSAQTQPAYLTTRRTIRLPFPLGEVRESLASVFAAPVVIRRSRLAAREEYAGRIDGDEVEMRLGRSHHTSGSRRFLVRGRLLADPPGTVLEMAITSLFIRVRWWFYVLLPITVICVGKGHRDGLGGRGLLLAAGFAVVALYGLAMLLSYLALWLWRRRAAKDVEAFLLKSLAGREGSRQEQWRAGSGRRRK